MHGSCVILTTLNKASMFIIGKCLIFEEKVKMIFPSKNNLIQMKTNRMSLIRPEDVSTMGEQFPSALTVYSGKIQCRIFQWVSVVTKSWSLPSRSSVEGGGVRSVKLITQITQVTQVI